MMTRSQLQWFVVVYVLLVSLVHFSAVGKLLNLKGLDIFQSRSNPDPDIAILAIDSHSLDRYGRWPWPRHVQAQILSKLNEVHPLAVGVDVAYYSPSNGEEDQSLALSLSHANFPVVLASEVVYAPNAHPQRFLMPLEGLTQSKDAKVGLTNLTLSPDSVSRFMPSSVTLGETTLQPMAYALAEVLNQPIIQKDPQFIRYHGPAGTFPTYSVADFLDNKIPPQALEKKIILLGATASSLHDTVLTPQSSSLMAGVEWQANVLSNLLQRGARQEIPQLFTYALSLFVGGVFLLGSQRLRPRVLLNYLVGLVFGTILVSFVLWQSGYALAYATLLLAILGLIGFHIFIRWLTAEREKRQLKQTFQPYFSSQVMEAILSDPTQLHLTGQERLVTIFFSDIRSFTTISEHLAPERLIALLKEYFSELTEEILATDGVIDKFIGDAIMAFWGAPLAQDDQADRAVQAALGMMKRLKNLQQKWLKEGYPLIDFGVGINTGIVTVGNMGSNKRFDYTVIGDDVNVASRLEGLNKEYKTHIIISESTKNLLKQKLKLKKLGTVQVKGKTKPVSIFEVKE